MDTIMAASLLALVSYTFFAAGIFACHKKIHWLTWLLFAESSNLFSAAFEFTAANTIGNGLTILTSTGTFFSFLTVLIMLAWVVKFVLLPFVNLTRMITEFWLTFHSLITRIKNAATRHEKGTHRHSPGKKAA